MDLFDEWKTLIPDAERDWNKMWDELQAEGNDNKVIWSDTSKIPFSDPEIRAHAPGLSIYPINRNTRDLILVIPGGAFLFKSSREAKPVAEAFYKKGYNAAILSYRCRPFSNDAILSDGIRALRFLRHYLKNKGLSDVRIITLGFSAGGILTSLINNEGGTGNSYIGDEIDREEYRPDAEIMIYGAFTDTGVIEEEPEVRRLCGFEGEKIREKARRSLTLNLPLKLPPLFMAQTDDDDPLFILDMAREWRKRGIPFEAHLFHGGCHGGGLYDGMHGAEKNTHVSHWFTLCTEWLETI